MNIADKKLSKIRGLRDEALSLARGGHPRRALPKLQQLEALEPDEPDWPRRAAECYRELNQRADQLKALERAAERYVRAHRIVQAMAMCRIMLGLDPKHPAALAWMEELPRTQQSSLATPLNREGATSLKLHLPPVREQVPVPVITPPAAVAQPSAAVSPPAVSPPAVSPNVVPPNLLPPNIAPPNITPPNITPPQVMLPSGSMGNPVQPSVPQPVAAAPSPPPLDRTAAARKLAAERGLAAVVRSAVAQRERGRSGSASGEDGSESNRTDPAEAAAPAAQAPSLAQTPPRAPARPPVVPPRRPAPLAAPPPSPPPVATSPLAAPPAAAPPAARAAPPAPRAAPSPAIPPPPRTPERVTPPPLSPIRVSPPPAALEPESSSLPPPSLPPLSLAPVLLLQAVPGSTEIPDGSGGNSGMFRLAIDDEPSRSEQARRQGRELLPAIPLFAEMHPQCLEQIWAKSSVLHLEPGEHAFHQNDPPEHFYVIVSGRVRFVDDSAANTEFYTLGENEFLGESSLISNEPRPASAVASEPTDLLVFDRETMRSCIQETPEVVPALLRFVRERAIEQLVHTSPLLTAFNTVERRALTGRFEFIQFEPGSLLIPQGSRSPGLFVLLSGSVEVIRTEAERELRLTQLERGEVFGEMSLLSPQKAVAHVRGARAGFALMLPASVFREVIMTHPQFLEAVSSIAERRREDTARLLASSR